MMANIPLINRLKYFRDHVWSDEFWRNSILDCGECRYIGRDRNRFDVDAVLWTRGPNFNRFTPEEVAQCVKQGAISCPNCRAGYEIYPDADHYLWMSGINGRATARDWISLFGVAPNDPEEQFLLPLLTYRLRNLERRS